MEIKTRAELVSLLRVIADPEWHGSSLFRAEVAENAAQVIEMLGESQDHTRAKLDEILAQMDLLLKRVPEQTIEGHKRKTGPSHP